ncbi:hypothetical protein KO566_11270 [Flavobacteriaceae bacterium XHP0103]|uniref:hypothetical protein n=1 Tax=Marixanthotalea marina TaxID=2844359 RepID=UPI00298A0278|nr:hypothetical protein [Marixanthotalea marina]MBU3822645.1 hypothetical protein [Marixanthotalea marina]
MKTLFNLILLVFVLTLNSCKNDKQAETATLSEYKFTDKGMPVNCDGIDQQLLNEAIFAFEDDIYTFFKDRSPNPNLALTYAQFMSTANNGRANYAEILTPHTVEIFKVLKTNPELWNTNNSASNLNYNSNFFDCISNNIRDNNLKTTLQALLKTGSMSPKLITAPLSSRYNQASNDKYLAAYIAFDLFYAKLFDVDLTMVKERAPEKVDFNLIPR